MIFVILIALAMIIPALILASSTIPRRTAVTGEAVSDRVLSVADATVDNVLTQINTFPFPFTTSPIKGENEAEITLKAQDYLISYYLSRLNGGVPDINNPITTFNQISSYVATYLYNLDTQEYYAVWDGAVTQDFPNGHIAFVSAVGPDGDVKTGTLKNLTTGALTTIDSIDSNYKTNNLWVEIDTNTQYWPGEPDKWVIKTTSYILSKPEIKRTVKAIASRGEVSSSADEYADGSWHTYSTIPGNTHYFSDYSGLYATKVYFGKFETTTGMIRGNQDVYMGGWAHDPVYASGTVTDIAIDDGNRHDGRFGTNKENLAAAKADGNAKDGYPQAPFPNGDTAIANIANASKLTPYYVTAVPAKIVFSVENGVGWVTINGNKLLMPLNGAIYVGGTATVSGTVKGRCTIGAIGDINIGGNIIYDTPPRLDKEAPINLNPDQLGLIAHGNILIPVDTFNNNHHLQIDAAMLAVTGNFGIGSGYTLHPINGTGEYEAWWNGCQATFKTDNAPAIVIGSSIKGYDIQHTNYDWNLRSYGPPPFYPPTGFETSDPIDIYPYVTDAGILSVLRGLKKSELTATGLIDYPWSHVYNGTTYYYGDTFNWYATATINKTALYRITWKEQIAEPVKP